MSCIYLYYYPACLAIDCLVGSLHLISLSAGAKAKDVRSCPDLICTLVCIGMGYTGGHCSFFWRQCKCNKDSKDGGGARARRERGVDGFGDDEPKAFMARAPRATGHP